MKYAECYECQRPIVVSDDDAKVCVDCCGRNRLQAYTTTAYWAGWLIGILGFAGGVWVGWSWHG